MIARRALILTAMAGLLAGAISQPALAVANDPLAIVNAIYVQVTKGNGDLGGAFMMNDKAAKAKYFSKSIIALWAKAEAHTTKGDVGPIDFDPATNSQDPSVKSFSAAAAKMDSGTATIVVKLQRGTEHPRTNPDDDVLRYDYVRDGGHWKIDDIRGAIDGKPWSMRNMLAESPKN
ncbi:MAG: hypothetical protein JWP25_2480 [Bradyrhizobium sp.]|jgi:hypothetical protein|nr:hypothetical protein [Bradyrhizobium sp.]